MFIPDPTFSTPKPGSNFFFIPDQNFSIADPGSASKNLSILTQKNWFKEKRRIQDKHP
jgi:hypothetical protein